MTSRVLSDGRPDFPHRSRGEGSFQFPRAVSCDSFSSVHFTIHVRERAVACALPRQALSKLADAHGRDGVGARLARFHSLRATIAILAAREDMPAGAPTAR
jgi:hypothetical protein